MKFSLSWLKEHLDTKATLDEIVDAMTMIGLEVESVDDPAQKFAPFTVGYVKEAHPHPDADKLRVCKVDTGSEVLEVVCGAPNARTGLKGVFAPVGTQPPNVDFMLEKRKIRGVTSNGMLCSDREMGFSDEHDGIIELPEDAPIGAPIAEVLGLDDPVIDFEVTPNRPDWNGIDGIARDLAAAGLGKLRSKSIEPIEGSFDCPMNIRLKFNKGTEEACVRFAGRLVRNVKNAPSPDWLQKQLRAIGLRPINALADITNYITYDRARPLHVYDFDKLTGAIHARMGESGEKFLALDGKEYEVDETMCVIADDSGVLGLGGIMGGEDTGCIEETNNVFIECALFDPLRTAQTGRKTTIVSDARYRFERGVDPNFVRPGLDMATQMVLELCGGEASTVCDAGQTRFDPINVDFRPERVKKLTGLDIPRDGIKQILVDLGFSVETAAEMFQVTAPTWRPDVSQEADLVEEAARIFGFDKLPLTPLPRYDVVTHSVLTEQQKRILWARRACAARGLKEAVTYSFTHQPWAEFFGGGAENLKLANPISSELSAMRPSIYPNLLTALQHNVDRGFEQVELFEVGPVYLGDAPDDQEIKVTGVRRGASPRHWQGQHGEPNVFSAKSDALSVLKECGAQVANVQVTTDAPDWYHPGRSGTLRLGPKNALAFFGELHPRILKEMDIKGPVVGFEIDIAAIPAARKKATKSKGNLELADLMAVTRDFAFLMDKTVPAEKILRAAKGADKKLIQDVSIFDLYEGKGIEDDKKSVAIMITLQPHDKTLTDDDLEKISNKVVAAVEKATGGVLRG